MHQRKFLEDPAAALERIGSSHATIVDGDGTMTGLSPRKTNHHHHNRSFVAAGSSPSPTASALARERERKMKRRILALANNGSSQHGKIGMNTAQLLILCLGLGISVWGLFGTWMILEFQRESSGTDIDSESESELGEPRAASFLRTQLARGLTDTSLSSLSSSSSSSSSSFQRRKHPTRKTIFDQVSEDAPVCHELESPDDITLTLVTQVSHDRLWMMEHHCDRYRYRPRGRGHQNHHHHHHRQEQHRMSIAVYSNATRDEIMDELTAMGCGVIGSENNNNNNNDNDNDNEKGVEVSVLDARTHGAWNDYPVNELRNLALSKVRTTHILYLDVDFWPSDYMYEILLGSSNRPPENKNDSGSGSDSGKEREPGSPVREALFADPKQALVIPALQLWRRCSEWIDCRDENLPHMERARTPSGLVDEIKNHKSISVFDPTNKGGHGSTGYANWFGQSPGSVLPIDCLQSNRYEPFVVVRYCRDLPPFQNAFAGYGKNKVTWTMHLVAKGYVFGQVGGVYLVHYPHLDSTSRQHWNQPGSTSTSTATSANAGTSGEISRPLDSKRSAVDRLFVEFKTWLAETVPASERRLELCGDAQDDDGKLWVDRSNPNSNPNANAIAKAKAKARSVRRTTAEISEGEEEEEV